MSKKEKTSEQAAAMQSKAVRFLRDVVGDEEKADEIAAMTLDQYIEHKGLSIINPSGSKSKTTRSETPMSTTATKVDLEEELGETNTVLDSVWNEILSSDDGDTDEGDALENIAEILNEFDPDRFPMDDDEEGETENQEEAA